MEPHSQSLVGDLGELRGGRVLVVFSIPKGVDPTDSVDGNDQDCEVVCCVCDYLEFLGEGLDLTLVVEVFHKSRYSSVCCPVHEQESALLTLVIPKTVVAVTSR